MTEKYLISLLYNAACPGYLVAEQAVFSSSDDGVDRIYSSIKSA
jgi:hypothetical protein